jgi:hypothetical protein
MVPVIDCAAPGAAAHSTTATKHLIARRKDAVLMTLSSLEGIRKRSVIYARDRSRHACARTELRISRPWRVSGFERGDLQE